MLQIGPNPKLVLLPWYAFPQIDKHDKFWRMGFGENYINIWACYYLIYRTRKYIN